MLVTPVNPLNHHCKIKVTPKKTKSIPRMVFSVIGDSVSFFPRPWPKAVFQTALIEAAKGGGGTSDKGLIHQYVIEIVV